VCWWICLSFVTESVLEFAICMQLAMLSTIALIGFELHILIKVAFIINCHVSDIGAIAAALVQNALWRVEETPEDDTHAINEEGTAS